MRATDGDSAQIALLLHMHQPDYRDPSSGEPGMPWVRLHALRGYTDVAWLILETGAPVTVNVVPSLLDQLQHYADGGSDAWERLSRVEAEALSPEQADFVRRRFVHGHPAMRDSSPRYRALAARVEELHHPQELRDLMVWSNLAWTGACARRDPLIRSLIEQDRGFSHAQQVALMDRLAEIVAGVLPLWRRLEHVSCTPLCHPILPLLVDLEHARRSLPHLPAELGARFRWPEDARRQLAEGRARVEAVLGVRPVGLWPSEGALSPEVVQIAHELGFAWIGADAGLLHRSERVGPPDLTRPWRLREGGPALLFRERAISDRIGFDYHQVPGWRAAQDTLDAATEVAGGRAGAVVPVILDGENPWEAYPDAGEGFLRALFGSGRLVSMSEAAARPGAGRLGALHTGSWINADLQIWAGDEADWRAWGLLGELRQAWEDAGRPEAAWPSVAAAEGSDWFWWFGPEFETPFADLFDELFRAHLSAGWRALGLAPPAALARPVQARRYGRAGAGGAMSRAAGPAADGADPAGEAAQGSPPLKC